MKLKNCRRCYTIPVVDKADLYGQPHTRIRCPKCGFTIWTREGGKKDPETVWNATNGNRSEVIFTPMRPTTTHKTPKGFLAEQCNWSFNGLKLDGDLNEGQGDF